MIYNLKINIYIADKKRREDLNKWKDIDWKT